ncbi:hypothetical protein BX600DRAFT_512674 [Xylariales sp. PMI_506]|nr:hypothetical protein BX600DRAFT_512674 [Xylariales sp. PMI_506]
MADPISMMFTAVKVGLAIGSFIEKRDSHRVSQGPASSESEEKYRRDVFLVMGTLGRSLQPLGITNYGALPAAREAVRSAMQARAGKFRAVFDDEMEEPLQYAVVLGMVFCAACWPMPVYRGFGAGVMSETHWGAVDYSVEWGKWAQNPHEPTLASFDLCISQLKTAVSSIGLLKSYPRELSEMNETYGSKFGYLIHGKDKKKAESWLKDMFAEGRKRGPPQPKDGSFTVTEVVIIHTQSGWRKVWKNVWDADKDTVHDVARYYSCPGKRFYAYLVDQQLELPPGRMLLSIDKVDYYIIKWLAGCDGTALRLVGDDELDDKHPKFKKKNRWICWFDQPSINIVAVRDENRVQQRERARSQPQQRRPAPPPPKPQAAPTRKVQAKYSFTAQAKNEISFKEGEVLEVIKESSGDGWIVARRNGQEGDIPEAYVKSL